MTTTRAVEPGRKRIGQVFTGRQVGRLLAALAEAESALTIIDPMAGRGDLLASCWEVGASPRVSAGVDIDPVAIEECQRVALAAGQSLVTVLGNAFSPNTWTALDPAWGLVITNPPYVRYQTGRASDDSLGFPVPSAVDIRQGLLQCLEQSWLAKADRNEFMRCAETYSGLADLAVPSWILCASLVAPGGTLALVMPSTWLSRDYAAPVVYLLRRYFETSFVVVDVDRRWFPTAQVQATLIVARRIEDKGTAIGEGRHLRIGVPGQVGDSSSTVRKWFPTSYSPERDFVTFLQEAGGGVPPSLPGLELNSSDEGDLTAELRRAGRRHPWLVSSQTPSLPRPAVPEVLRRLLPRNSDALQTLELAGWNVGQGLRTGANQYFYVSQGADGTVTSRLLPGQPLDLPVDAMSPALQRQEDLPSRGRRARATAGRVLLLGHYALEDDLDAANGPRPWKAMGGDLRKLTTAAASHIVNSRSDVPHRLPELSAVRTNVRPGSVAPPRPALFWYQLPPLAPRHEPALLVPRVNSGHPRVYINDDKLVIDANFSTLWPAGGSAIPSFAMLALLASSWTIASLEAIGTILGGGALKVEATHLRRLLIPVVPRSLIRQLENIGAALADGGDDRTIEELDELVFAMIGLADSKSDIRAQAGRALAQRSK